MSGKQGDRNSNPTNIKVKLKVEETSVNNRKQEKREKPLKSTIKSPYTTPNWPIDTIPTGLIDDLIKLSKYIVHGVNSVTKAFETGPPLRFVIFADATHETIPKIMTEHIKTLCVLKGIPFLNLKCTSNQLGASVKVKTCVLAVRSDEDHKDLIDKFVTTYKIDHKIVIPWFQNSEYQPLVVGKMEKKRKEAPTSLPPPKKKK
jgi:ribosomal protein L7Ae-like RNA K-turn-binding protein